MAKFEFITRMEMLVGSDKRCESYTKTMIDQVLAMLPDTADADEISDIITGIVHASYRAGFVQGCSAGATDARNYMVSRPDWEKPLSDIEVELATHLLYDKMRDHDRQDKMVVAV